MKLALTPVDSMPRPQLAPIVHGGRVRAGVGVDVAALVADRRVPDRVLDGAVEEQVRRADLAAETLQVEDIEVGVRELVEDVELDRDDVDVDVDLGRDAEVDGVDVVDDEDAVGPVEDEHRVPGVLDDELAEGAEDLAVGVHVLGLEPCLGRLVVEEVADHDPVVGVERVVDLEQAGERARRPVEATHLDVAGLGDDGAGLVDDQDRVRLAEHDDGRLPVDVLAAVAGAGLPFRAAVEEGAVLVGVPADGHVLGRLHEQVRR